MGSASLDGEAGSNNVTINVTATDETDAIVTRFVVLDEVNGINNLNITAVDGKIKLVGLIPGTDYNLTIKAKDNGGNVSENSTIVSFTTALPTSECSGSRGHFAPADATKKIKFEFSYSAGSVTYKIMPIDSERTLDFALIQVNGVGNNLDIASDGKSATYTLADATAGDIQKILFLYSLDDMEGNEQTAIDINDINIILYIVGDCGTTNIKNVYTNDLNYSVRNNTLSIQKIEGKQVNIYNTVGSIVYSANGKENLSIQLNNGVYFVKVSNSTSKIIIK